MILLLQTLEPAIDFVEMAGHIAPQVGDLPIDLIKSEVDLLEPAGNDPAFPQRIREGLPQSALLK